MSCNRSSCDFFGVVNSFSRGEPSQVKGKKKDKVAEWHVILHSGLATCFGEKADNIKIGKDINTEIEKIRMKVF